MSDTASPFLPRWCRYRPHKHPPYPTHNAILRGRRAASPTVLCRAFARAFAHLVLPHLQHRVFQSVHGEDHRRSTLVRARAHQTKRGPLPEIPGRQEEVHRQVGPDQGGGRWVRCTRPTLKRLTIQFRWPTKEPMMHTLCTSCPLGAQKVATNYLSATSRGLLYPRLPMPMGCSPGRDAR